MAIHSVVNILDFVVNRILDFVILQPIGKRIRKARKKQNLTQEQLAEMIGVKSAHISNIESGKKPFSFNVFVRLYK
jgi:DNA-binding XRE family transcriptional regulator